MDYTYEYEKIPEISEKDYNIIQLDKLNDDEKEIIDPLVPPTSGLRMVIFDVKDKHYNMTRQKTFHFLRVIKGISVVAKEELQKESPNILIVTDDRPSADVLLGLASRIFAYEGYTVYHQSGEGETDPRSNYVRGDSKMATPYAAASVALLDEIDVVLMITASHNALKWNGLKFYIQRPIPISGTVMKKVSAHALSLNFIEVSKSYTPKMIDAEKTNNDYILKLVSKIVDLNVLKGKNIVIWPFLGAAPELVDVLESTGANVILIDNNLNPPDPTRGFEESEVERIMKENNAKISIMLDADRDRIVFIIRIGNKFYNFEPNQLYTAMHNILSSEMNKNIVNVKTIPSDPGCDDTSKVNFVCGVGYKHLGILQYLAADLDVPSSQVELSVIYHFTDNNYEKVRSQREIKEILKNTFPDNSEMIFALWEESGGHTFNLFNYHQGKLTSKFPVIGDKYPVPAILVLCTLLEMDYDFNEYIADIGRERTTISATDVQKIEYIDRLKNLIGEKITIDKFSYTVNAFSDMDDKVDVVYLKSDTSVLFVRPSGTGPNIRIYVFGPKTSFKQELENVAKFVKQNSH
jgi:phosphomannomutase